MDSDTQPLEEPRSRGEAEAAARRADAEDMQPKEADEDDEDEHEEHFSPLIIPG